jgi:hypothetical protein
LGSATLAVGVVLVTIALKAWIVCWAGFDLTFDEAYYWHWSKNLDWCYFSKGPGIALMIRATTSLAGDTPFGIRLGAMTCSTLTLILLYVWGSRFFSCRATALLTVLLFSVSPFLTGLGMLSTIDSPLILFWTLATILLWKAIETDQLRWWMGTGLAVAMGTQFKFTMLFFLAAILLATALSAGGWRRLGSARWLWPVGVVAVSLLPILFWNIGNHWITFDHTVRKASTQGNEFLLTWRFIAPSMGQQLGVMSPLIALGVAVAFGYLVRDGRGQGTSSANGLERSRAIFLLSVTLPIVGFYGLLAFHRTVEANWMAPAYVTLLPAAAYYWLRPFGAVQRWSLALALMMGMAMQVPLFLGDTLYEAGLPQWFTSAKIPFRPTLDMTNRVRGWKQLGEIAQAERVKWEQRTGKPVFFFTDHYSLAALVGFYAKQPENVFCIPSPVPQNQFDIWAIQGRRPPEGAVGICVYDLVKAGRLADPFFARTVEDYSPGEFKRGQTLIRTYLFRVMDDYQGNGRWFELARQVSPPSWR